LKKNLDFLGFFPYSIGMIKKLEKLQNDLAWWQDKLNRSRKESLRSIRAVHVQHLQSEIAKLTQSVQAHDLEILSDMPRK
jgi:cob(I)alamin adenosyltransferase